MLRTGGALTLPPLLALLSSDRSPRRTAARAALHALAALLPVLAEHLHPTVHALLSIVDEGSAAAAGGADSSRSSHPPSRYHAPQKKSRCRSITSGSSKTRSVDGLESATWLPQ